ncbi:hypothetical protein D1164_02560 [Mariniphaga sediminis]|jgi:hypothetical protein|uniref:Uncharacterized protein n=1 Tax=Mariniphaga sediminis TaxID=1628158 RepID=A0A399CXT0_9BACT|nr:hypothetical protein [Mariniphaga sediminis]MBD3623224.1 hypothetical protein [Sunxiuqinia sp.]RIH64229.1 hypothetical protein D1164_15510 [Mariniphaga sediminis]RIH66508.1 hypothetical protein D1164_02560 [Mariniphaga sediminis]
MKKLNVLSLFVLCCLFLPALANAIDFSTKIINYEIEAVENVTPDKSVEKVWNLTYEGSDKPVTVVKRSTAKGVVYIATTSFFEVCYGCSQKGFGVRPIKKTWSTVPTEINDAVLNADEVKRQEVITPQKIDDEKALGLIANYLPNLLNGNYKHLLN